jgi:hypothetical protein
MKLKSILLTIFILCLTIGIVSANGHHDKSYKDGNKNKHGYDKHNKYNTRNNNPASNPPDNPTVSDNTDDGHTATDNAGVNLINNPNAKDPTYDQVVSFIKSDQTDKIPYSSSYQCDQSARDVHNNAEAAGIRTAYVSIKLSNPDDLQFCDAFQTTDRGLIYVDCTGDPGGPETSNCDCIVKDMSVGAIYHPESLYSPFDRDYTQGTIESFKLYW